MMSPRASVCLWMLLTLALGGCDGGIGSDNDAAAGGASDAARAPSDVSQEDALDPTAALNQLEPDLAGL